jgi:DNA/RNA-binding domain of Phe-tRNA-synthetase-like protein
MAGEDRLRAQEPAVVAAPVAPEIAAELPGLGLAWCALSVTDDPLARSPAALRERLRALSDRHRGAQAIVLRSRPIAHAYRVLFRHLGMDPDVRRVPVEAAALERLQRGGFPVRNRVDDALLVATVETGVGVWALDAATLHGEPGIGSAGGRVVVADGSASLRSSPASPRRTVAQLFGAPVPEHAVTRATRRVALYAVLAPGVPDMAVEEALWTAWEMMCA